ncbi:hypothetical protein ISP15_01310 [Dyella jejuensis]|uniref:Tol-pal system protein YbgF n=1 Tax=Dyella jejuensis TaxID=1432009 RepID=A0ABW8JER5_9GAMM
MQRLALTFASCCVLVSTTLWAGAPPAGAGQQSAARLSQRVAQHQAEIERLQKDVGQQESASQAAAQRLQQQDHTIAQLREQLKAAQEAAGKPPAGH